MTKTEAYQDAYSECNPGDKSFVSPLPTRITLLAMEIYAKQFFTKEEVDTIICKVLVDASERALISSFPLHGDKNKINKTSILATPYKDYLTK